MGDQRSNIGCLWSDKVQLWEDNLWSEQFIVKGAFLCREGRENLFRCIFLSVAIHIFAIVCALPVRFDLIQAQGDAAQQVFLSWKRIPPVGISDAVEGGGVTKSLIATESDVVIEKIAVPAAESPAASGSLLGDMPKLIFVRELDLERLPDSESGYVEVELLVAPNGLVLRVALISTTLPGAFFSELEDAFLAARFNPGLRWGEPVFARVRFRTFFGASDGGGQFVNRRLGASEP